MGFYVHQQITALLTFLSSSCGGLQALGVSVWHQIGIRFVTKQDLACCQAQIPDSMLTEAVLGLHKTLQSFSKKTVSLRLQ